jgi:hypothetical protein
LNWAKLKGFGSQILGLSFEEIGDLTFAELVELQTWYGRRNDFENYRVGLICSTIRNVQRSKEEEHFFIPSDFFPSLKPAEIQAPVIEDDPRITAMVLEDFAVSLKSTTKKRKGRTRVK